MLPIFKKLKEAPSTGLIIKHRAPDEDKADKDDPGAGTEACGRAALDAIKSDDAKAFAEAMVDLFQIADSEPHEEGEHTSGPPPHSYDAQNIKAGQE